MDKGGGCSLEHLLRRLYRMVLVHREVSALLHRTGNQYHLGPSGGTFICQGKSHLAGRIVADEAHRVYLLISRSCGYHHCLAHQVAIFGSKVHFQVADDILRLLHTAFPHQMAGEFSVAGSMMWFP